MITAGILKTLVNYDYETGDLIWKARSNKSWNTRYAGRKVGSINADGYLSTVITYKGISYPLRVHRLIWLYHMGEWPRHDIDHIDRNKINNRIENLRDVETIENLSNRTHLTGESGVRGVVKAHKGSYTKPWAAEGSIKGRKFKFGAYDTIEEAKVAYEVGMAKIDIDSVKPNKRKIYPVTYENLSALYHYDPNTGLFYNRSDITKPIGSSSSGGYKQLKIFGKTYRIHILAWLLMTKDWPDKTKVIDHKDNNKNNNKWNNLRELTIQQNNLNKLCGKMRGIRRSGAKKEKWEARISINKIHHHIGTFSTLDEAKQAWIDFIEYKGIANFIPQNSLIGSI